jgi:hypothetical protein
MDGDPRRAYAAQLDDHLSFSQAGTSARPTPWVVLYGALHTAN